MNFNEVIQSPGRQITKRVYIKAGNIQKYINNDDFVSAKTGFNFKLGDSTVCRFLELEVKNPLNIGLYPDYAQLIVYAKLPGNNPQYNKDFGKFYAQNSTPEYDANNKTYIYKLYDNFINAMIPYEPLNIIYPTTVQTFFNRLIDHLGWSGSITLNVIGSKELTEDVYDELNLTYRDVIDDILQANGTIGYFSVAGNLVGAFLKQTTVPISIDDDILKNTNVDIGNKFGPINSFTLSRANGLDNVFTRDNPSIQQYGLTNITIADNILLNDDDREDYLSNLSYRYSNVLWYMYDCELTGYGGFNFLDKIEITTNGETYSSFVFNNEITIDEGYREVIYNTVDTVENGNQYTYNDTETKADKEAEIRINKKIGEVDIRGKTINMTADNVAIDSQNFKLDKEGNMTCNSATMTGATINGGELALHDLGKNNRSSIKIKKDVATYTPVVGNSQYIYSVSFETPSDYISSTNTEKTDFLQFTRTVYDDIKGQTTETTTYSFTKTNEGETIEENIYNEDLEIDKNNTIWHCYDESGETIIESTQPHSFGINKAYLTFTIYTNIDPTPYFKFVNQVESGITEINSTDVITNRYYAYPEELGVNNNAFAMLSSSQLNTSSTQSILRLNALDYSGTGASGLYMMARTRDPQTYPMPLVMEITGNNWTRDILKNQILWDGGTTGYLMIASQTATLSHKVSEQPHGIVLVWSAYSNSQAQNYNWHCDFVPKEAVALANTLNGNGFSFQMASSKFTNIATKYVYIRDGSIGGNADNNATGTSTGTDIKYTNNAYVLRYVIGV